MALLTVWRIVRPEYASTAYSGEGSRRDGGRFNSAGRAVVYASQSLALAMLEQLVRAGSFARIGEFLCVPARLDDSAVEERSVADLPAGWDARPYTPASQAVGDAWLDAGRTLALRVPSVVVPFDHNVLINPAHEGFAGIEIGDALAIPIDPRLAGRAL